MRDLTIPISLLVWPMYAAGVVVFVEAMVR